jgi:Uma2 family endonuclease
MLDLTFESTGTVTREQFARYVAQRERQGDVHHYELLNGRVVMNPPAGYPHGEIDNSINRLIGDFAVAHRLGRVFGSGQGFELPSGDVLEPDFSFVSNERWKAMGSPQEGEFLRVAPDLAVEILSARTASTDRGEKKAIYERNGVREYWLVDWRRRELTVFRLDVAQGRYDGGEVFAETDRVRSDVFPGLQLELRELLPAR